LDLPVFLGGADVIDSRLSWMYNLRYSNVSNNFWFAADKSHPNAFRFLATKGLMGFDDTSPLSANAQPFLAFDVVTPRTAEKIDYLIGSTYGPNDRTALIGLPIQIAGSDGSLLNAYFPSLYFYGVTIDQDSLQSDGSVKFYLAGWKHNPDKTLAGFVVAQARAVIGTNTILTFNPDRDVLILEGICYDIFTEYLRPQIYLNRGNIIVSVPGHCNAFYKTAIPAGNSELVGQTFQQFTPPGVEKIVASILNRGNGILYFALKNYNSATITIKSFDTVQWAMTSTIELLAVNETSPVFAIDEVSNILYIATAGFDRIYQWQDVNGVFKELGTATLPSRISLISSMVYQDEFLYMVTDEPNAQIARISLIRFCDIFCGPLAYCIAQDTSVPGICSCTEGYELPPGIFDTVMCLPHRDVNVITNMINQETGAYVFLVLFLITLIIGIIGWGMWWRARRVTYNDAY